MTLDEIRKCLSQAREEIEAPDEVVGGLDARTERWVYPRLEMVLKKLVGAVDGLVQIECDRRRDARIRELQACIRGLESLEYRFWPPGEAFDAKKRENEEFLKRYKLELNELQAGAPVSDAKIVMPEGKFDHD